jgi:hypothetical protein
MSTLTTNLTNDYVPSAPVNFDRCFENLKDVKFEDLPLHVPLVNIMSSVDDLKVASMKTEEVQQTIDQETKYNENLYMVATSWGTTLFVICIIIICICCSCCCCKCCRNGFVWLWNKWNPRDCWLQTQDECCVSIYNYNGSRVKYSKTNPYPAISIKSPPELGNILTNLRKYKTKNQRYKKNQILCQEEQGAKEGSVKVFTS